MEEELCALEKRTEELELMLAASPNERLVNSIESLRTGLKNYCMQEHADELLKRPIEQLNSIINAASDPSDSDVTEKVQVINDQVGVLTHRLELFNNINELKDMLADFDMNKVVRSEDAVDGSLQQFTELNQKLDSLTSLLAKEQSQIEQLFDLFEAAVSESESA